MPAPKGRDLELTRKRLGEWFGVRLPDATQMRVGELSGPGATGFSNETVLFDLDYEKGGVAHREGLVCRIQPTGFQVFPDYDLGRQFKVMQMLAATDVPVPAMLGEEQDASLLGAPFYVMRRVDGDIPTDNPPYHVGGWVKDELSPEGRAKMWWSSIENMARIHNLDWQALGFGFLDAPERGATPLDQELHYYVDYLEWAARGKPQPTIDAALAWLKANKPPDEPLRLCWGDARMGNMIFQNGECAAVLDWEMVSLGNPEKDLAWNLFLDRHHSEGLESARLPGFPSHADTVSRWEQLTGLKMANLHYYQVFAGFRFGVVMVRLAQQMQHYEVLPADSDFETNNIVTRLLAKLLDLPAPAAR